MDELSNFVTANHALVGAAMLFLWRTVAGKKADKIERRITETARAAWTFARGISGHDTAAAELSSAKARARTMLARLQIPLKASVLALLDHELELLAASDIERERVQREHALTAAKAVDSIAARAAGMADAFAAAEARGKANALNIEIDFDTATTPLEKPKAPAP